MASPTYRRPLFESIAARLREPRRFIQVLAGPRQAGKTTLVQQTIDALGIPAHYASADSPGLQTATWIEQQWEIGRLRTRDAGPDGALLALDEVQKVAGWSDVVKGLWDEDGRNGTPLKVMLSGSVPLLVQRGLTESLAGRFEIVRVMHWSYEEMCDAFGWDLETYIFFGGYPGAAPLIGEKSRWAQYIRDSLIETTISRDILLLTRVDKPALLRRLFLLGCEHSGQVLSYQKMLGQLQDAGNTVTLAHYLDLLDGAGMLSGIAKYSGRRIRQRASSPKLQVLNTALISAQSPLSLAEAREDRESWGRRVESTVGARLLNGAAGTEVEVFYWLDRNREVDFVLRSGDRLTAIEVKSGRSRAAHRGLEAFSRAFDPGRKLLVGGSGMPLEEFLRIPVGDLVR